MTVKENQLAREMTGLIKKIEEHTEQLNSGERVPLLELEMIVSKIEILHQKSIILKYLHANIDEIQSAASVSSEEIKPMVEAQLAQTEIFQKKPLHEKIAQDAKTKSLAEKLQNQPVKSLPSAISLNEKLMFLKELFGGNQQEYNTAISQLDSLQNFEEAKKYLELNFSEKNKWDKKTDTVNLLMNILEKRY